jgi:hypothetical protein
MWKVSTLGYKLAINKKWIEEIADYNWDKIVWFTGN